MSAARRVLWLFLLNVAFVVAFGWFAGHFEMPGGPSVLDLELSFTGGTFRQILLIWGSKYAEGVGWFRTSVVVLDFLFPLAYALFLSALYAWVVTTGGGRRLRIGQLLPWFAAALDWVENAFLLLLLRGLHDAGGIRQATFSGGLVGTMSLAAALKVACLIVSLALTLATVFSGPRGRVLRLARFSALSVALGSLPLIVVGQGQDLLVSLADPLSSRPLARFAFFAVLGVWAASVWYWARVLLMIRFDPAEPPRTPDEQAFATLTPRVLGTLTLALAAVAFLRASKTVASGSGHYVVLALFAAVCAVEAVAFWYLVVNRRALLTWFGFSLPAEPPHLEVGDLPAGTWRAAAAAGAASGVFLLLFWLVPLWIAPLLGAVTVLLVAAANTVFLGSVGVFLSQRFRLPVVALCLVAAAGFSYWNDNHDVRLARKPNGEGSTATVTRLELARAFRAWFAERQTACAGCTEVPVYLVAAEGGGIRAAYWTAVALARLTDRKPEVGPRIFAISGVSGGSVGAAVYAALVRDAARGPLACAALAGTRPLLEGCATRVLGGPLLAPVLAKLVGPDFAQWFVPLPIRSFDRAWALEDAWSVAYREATGRDTLADAFLEAWPGPASGVPALLLNGTHVQTGRRILASPFTWTSRELPDTEDLLTLLGADLPLATAAHNSARFSYVSPAGRLRTADGEDRGHIVDGGYFENSGAQTVHDVLRTLKKDLAHDPVSGPQPRFLVLYLCNSPERCCLPPYEPGWDGGWRRARNLAELFSPLRALLGAREARGSLALADLRRELDPRDFVELGVKRALQDRERETPLPLGWQISQGVRDELSAQANAPVCGGAEVP